MKTIIATSAILCFIALNLNAQDSTYVKVKPNELSFGFYNIFQLTDSPNFGILYKRRIKNGALRVGSKFYFSTRKTEYNIDDQISEYQGYSLSPRLGYEFHKNIKRWQVFYGADLTYYYGYGNNTTEYSDSNTEYREEVSKTNNYGLRPLIGVKYQINPWLSVTTETAVNFSYNTSENYTLTTFTDGDSQNEQTRNSKGFSVWLEPLGLFSINFDL